MDNIITATFNDYTYARTTSLWQYDYGQILQIEGITLPATFEVHFSDQDQEGESLIQIGAVKDKTAQVQIPDSFLRKAAGGNYSIYAFIYLTDTESGETKYKITIPVRARPKPNTDLVDAPEEKKFFREAIEEVNNAADRAEKAGQEAEGSAGNASGYAEKAETAANYATETKKKLETLQQSFSETVEEQTNAAVKEITEKGQTAVKAVADQQELSVQTLQNQEKTSKEAIIKHTDTEIIRANTSMQTAKDNLDESIKTAETTKENLDSSAKVEKETQEELIQVIKTAGTVKTNLDTSVTKAEETQKTLSDATNSASELKVNLNKTVEKATELNTSLATQIEESTQLKEDLKSTGEKAVSDLQIEAQTQLEKVEKASEGIIADRQQIQTNKEDIATLKEDISNKITKFYASNQGNTNLQDSDDGKVMDMMIYGKSEQFATTGKNLLKIRDGTQTTRGVTVTAKDGVFVLKGTATETGWAIFDVDSFVLDGTCVLSSNISTGIRVVVANKSFKGVLQQNKSDTLENAEVSKVCFTITEGKTYGISNILVQIEKGSVATSYEPYTGGIPSPNLSYPQEIKSVVNPVVKVVGKNLLNCNWLETGAITGDGMNDDKNTKRVRLNINHGIRLKKGKYTINSSTAKYVVFYPFIDNVLDKSIISQSGAWLSVPHTIDVLNECDVRFAFKIDDNTNVTPTLFEDIQIEYSSTVTTYEPYHEHAVPLAYTLNAIPVSSNGNVIINGQRYIADYVDAEENMHVQNVKEVVIDKNTVKRVTSMEQWDKEKSDKLCAFRYNDSTLNPASNKMISRELCTVNPDYYEAWGQKSGKEIIGGVGNNPKYIDFYLLYERLGVTKNDTDHQKIDALRTWIENNPIHFMYALRESIKTPLTPEEVDAFKALATSYPVTNISTLSDQLAGYTVFNYPISMEQGWNYVKKQLNDNRNYIYNIDMQTQDTDLQAAEAYVNSEYAVALTELEV